MPLLKKIIKNDNREVIIKWTGSGTDTLTLASLVSVGQTLTGVYAPGVVLIGTNINSSGSTTITRNSQVALQIDGSFEFQTDGVGQAGLDENMGSDIVVNMVALGTLILRVKKMQGYTGV